MTYMIATPTRSHYWTGKEWAMSSFDGKRYNSEKEAKKALPEAAKLFALAKVVRV